MSTRKLNSKWSKMVLRDSFQPPVTIKDAMRQQGLNRNEAERWLKYMVTTGRLVPGSSNPQKMKIQGNQQTESESYYWMPDSFYSNPFKK